MLHDCFIVCSILLFILASLNVILIQQIQGQQEELKEPCPPDLARQRVAIRSIEHVNRIIGENTDDWGKNSLLVAPETYQKETILGKDGQDCLVGSNGNDLLLGGNGADTLVGGKGTDTLDAGRDDRSKDTFVCGGDADKLLNMDPRLDSTKYCHSPK